MENYGIESHVAIGQPNSTNYSKRGVWFNNVK